MAGSGSWTDMVAGSGFGTRCAWPQVKCPRVHIIGVPTPHTHKKSLKDLITQFSIVKKKYTLLYFQKKKKKTIKKTRYFKSDDYYILYPERNT